MTDNIERPWGYYKVTGTGQNCLTKLLYFIDGCGIRKQKHEHRSEVWYVVSGSGVAAVDDIIYNLTTGSTVVIPVGAIHTLTGIESLVVFETQFGNVISEEDIIICN